MTSSCVASTINQNNLPVVKIHFRERVQRVHFPYPPLYRGPELIYGLPTWLADDLLSSLYLKLFEDWSRRSRSSVRQFDRESSRLGKPIRSSKLGFSRLSSCWRLKSCPIDLNESFFDERGCVIAWFDDPIWCRRVEFENQSSTSFSAWLACFCRAAFDFSRPFRPTSLGTDNLSNCGQSLTRDLDEEVWGSASGLKNGPCITLALLNAEYSDDWRFASQFWGRAAKVRYWSTGTCPGNIHLPNDQSLHSYNTIHRRQYNLHHPRQASYPSLSVAKPVIEFGPPRLHIHKVATKLGTPVIVGHKETRSQSMYICKTCICLMRRCWAAVTLMPLLRYKGFRNPSIRAILLRSHWNTLRDNSREPTALIWPFIPHVKQTLLIGQDRVECSSRAPQVKHWTPHKFYLMKWAQKARTIWIGHAEVLCCPSAPQFLQIVRSRIAASSRGSWK